MKNILTVGVCALALFAGTMQAQKPVTVGGAAMHPNKNIIENAVNSKDHTTLVAAVKEAGLGDTLQGLGPFTVFAPVNDAFAALPAGTVDNLLKLENKATLTAVLTYHVVSGRLNSQALVRMIKENNGKAMLKSVQGEELTAMLSGRRTTFQASAVRYGSLAAWRCPDDQAVSLRRDGWISRLHSRASADGGASRLEQLRVDADRLEKGPRVSRRSSVEDQPSRSTLPTFAFAARRTGT